MTSQVASNDKQLNFYYGEGYTEEAEAAIKRENITHLDLSRTNHLQVDVADINAVDPETFTMKRRNGFGGSDSGVLLGVNPFTTLDQLIRQKASKHLSEEEKAIALQTSVRMGNDLEPLVIKKWAQHFEHEVIKPADMYAFGEYPFLKMNFDGVTDVNGQYIPVEIKVVTDKGQRHYNPSKALFNEFEGFRPMPQDVSNENMSIEQKAAYYGIPPYYYTQLQQEMFALNAPFGYLSTLFVKDWRNYTFYVWKDQRVWDALILQGYKAWQKVEALRGGDPFWETVGSVLT